MAVAIVTGASSGIGRAIAKRLLERGLTVYGMARRFDDDAPLHRRFTPILCDLRDTDALVDRTREALETEGRLSLLVNNAGVGYFGPHETLPTAHLKEMVQTNLLAPLVLTRETLRYLRADKGTIINIASTAAVTPHRLGGAYAATKAGLLQFARCLFEEVRKSGVKVVSLVPDMTKTAFHERAKFEPSRDAACHLTPECVAAAVGFVLDQRPGTVITEVVLKPERLKVSPK
jgi:short-subunit dehydrogenase